MREQGRHHGRGRGFGRGRYGGGPRRSATSGLCTMDTLVSGDEVEILAVDDEGARMHALRFGMAEGACATCVTCIPAGPIVMRSGRQEIAVGRRLARRISVRHIGSTPVAEG